MLRILRGNGGLYQELLNKEPHVVSITFWREEVPTIQQDDNVDGPKTAELGIMIDKTSAEEEGETSGGDYEVTDIQDNPESLLYGMPIEVGDRLVAVNSQPCYGLDIQKLTQMIATKTGIVTLTLRKTRMAPFQDELRLAVFIDSQKHTCIPMDICLFKEEEKLSIFALYDHFDMDAESNSKKNKNDWLESSCLSQGQVLLSVNDKATFSLEEDDALAVMNEKLNNDEVLTIKTYLPSRVSANENPDMVDRVVSYIIQLEHRMTRTLAQTRNENDDLNYSASPYPVFSSAVELDKTLRRALNRCISISTGKPLFRLYLLMEDIWAKYANVLIRNFPQDSPFSRAWRTRLGNEKAKYTQQENTGDSGPAEAEKNGTNDKSNGNASSSGGWLFSRRQDAQAASSDKTRDASSAPDSTDDECGINNVPTFESVESDTEEKKKDNQEAPEGSSSGRGWFFSRRQPETDSRMNLGDESKSLDGDENGTTKETHRLAGDAAKTSEPKDKEINIRAEICHVVCTGSYCLDVLVERENALREKIDEGFKIDFGEAKTVFREEVIDKGIVQLVDSVKFQAEPIFVRMTRIRWQRCEEVGDTSPYAIQAVLLLKKRITSLVVQLPPMILQKFKYDLMEAICELFYASLTKINRISAVGTQQLLLDVATLKIEFVALLRISEPSKDTDSDFADERMADPQGFVKELLKKPEALLKLAGTNVGVDELLGTLDGKAVAEKQNEERTTSKNESTEAESGSRDDANGIMDDEDDEDDETTIVFDHLEDLETEVETPAFSSGFDLDDKEPDVE